MNRFMFALAVFAILGFGLTANSHAAATVQNGLTIFDGTKLVGAMVKAPDGVALGRIDDLAFTSDGLIEFAIVSQVTPPGIDYGFWHVVAVPFNALTISEGKSQEIQVVFNADKEKFYEAPEAPSSLFNSEGQVNRNEVAELDRYFGVQPYWTYPYYPYYPY